MKLFSEIYSTYYQITEMILKKEKVTKSEIRDIISKNGFSETMLFLEPKITGNDGYGLLFRNNDGYESILKKPPHIPMSALEKRWLCAVIKDRKCGLFLDMEQRKELCALMCEEPLYQNDHFEFFDRFSDGDDYEDEEYIRHFRDILSAIHDRTLIKISFQTRKGDRVTHYFRAIKLEYSAKNDRFRAHVILYHKNNTTSQGIINLSQITLTECTTKKPPENLMLSCQKKDAVIRISDERNAVNRFMMEFAELERVSEYDETTKECFVRIRYDQKDEAEILIRLLSFGRVIEVVTPHALRQQMRDRVNKQIILMKEN